MATAEREAPRVDDGPGVAARRDELGEYLLASRRRDRPAVDEADEARKGRGVEGQVGRRAAAEATEELVHDPAGGCRGGGAGRDDGLEEVAQRALAREDVRVGLRDAQLVAGAGVPGGELDVRGTDRVPLVGGGDRRRGAGRLARRRRS